MNDPIVPRNLVDQRAIARWMLRRATTMPATCRPEVAAKRGGAAPLHRTLLVPLLVAAVAGSPPSRAQTIAADTHRPNATGQQQLQLSHGQRWPADVALREGMRRIRAVALWMQHAQADGPLTARQSRAAAASIEDSVAAIVDHPPRGAGIDPNLHILLARILAADGLPQLLDALELYPRYFNDPGWQPVGRNKSPDH